MVVGPMTLGPETTIAGGMVGGRLGEISVHGGGVAGVVKAGWKSAQRGPVSIVVVWPGAKMRCPVGSIAGNRRLWQLANNNTAHAKLAAEAFRVVGR
jgi:hypothetical protein